MNVFKEGKGTITIWENTGGTRGAQIFQLKGIPLTPGPLVVVVKVASSLVKQPAKYWPPALPDCVETIAASYVQSQQTSKVRLFNLSPDTKVAGMSMGGTVLAVRKKRPLLRGCLSKNGRVLFVSRGVRKTTTES